MPRLVRNEWRHIGRFVAEIDHADLTIVVRWISLESCLLGLEWEAVGQIAVDDFRTRLAFEFRSSQTSDTHWFGVLGLPVFLSGVFLLRSLVQWEWDEYDLKMLVVLAGSMGFLFIIRPLLRDRAIRKVSRFLRNILVD